MKKIIQLFLLTFAIFTIGCSCSYNSIHGNGNEITKTFNVDEFEFIDASNAFEIEVLVGESQSVKVSTDENIMEYVKVFVKGNKLYLGMESGHSYNENVKATISVESLKGIDLSGACKIDVKHIDATQFNVDVSGACKGKLSGKVTNLNMDLSGATKLNTVDLIAQNLNIDMSGASKLDVHCENELKVEASGASKINVYGDPKSSKTDFSGASSISYKWF